MTQKLEIFPDYTNRNFTNLNTYKTCDDDESCLMYMFINGENIYHELDLFNSIPKQLEQDKINNVFSTNNLIRNTLLTDSYIKSLKQKHNVDNNFIINSILMHLRPILFSNTNVTEQNINQIKEQVEQTINFELGYMNTIENQITFLTNPSTTNHIKSKINTKIQDLNLEVKDHSSDYVT